MTSREDQGAPASLSGARRSKSIEESRQAELERIIAMSPMERAALALSLGRRQRALASMAAATAKAKADEGRSVERD